MNIAIITLFPQMFNSLTCDGIISRGIKKGLVELSFYNPRDYTSDVHRTVDDRPFGGGPGMVMMAEPLSQAIDAAKAKLGNDSKVVYFAPFGETLSQGMTAEFLSSENLILLCGRYEGVDQRILDEYVDSVISLGDFVLSGGEIPAMAFIDMISRHVPGVLGNADSAQQESFMPDGYDFPHYTRPEDWRGKKVPEVLTSGHHQNIQKWRSENRRSDMKKTK